MKVGLVLGAGGVTGAAYLSGALAALHYDTGWDPRDADVIVGTSAGSLVGALLRSNVAAGELCAWTVGAPLADPAAALIQFLERPDFEPVSLRQFLRPPRPPHPRALWATMRRPWRIDPLRAVLTHVADGKQLIAPHLEFLGDDWPDRAFYCCAVRRDDGRRAVFGRPGTPEAGLGAAVAASCAVPGYFAPVTVAGVRYIDGGVASTTNADAVSSSELDLVVVVCPMAAQDAGANISVDGAMRRHVGRRLDREVRRLRARGVQVVVFAPGAETLAHITHDFMSDEHASEIVGAAFLETGEQLAALDRAGAEVVAPLRARRGRARPAA